MAVQDTVRVIGCGNADAGDDAAGLLAVRAVVPRFAGRPDVEVLEVRDPMWIADLLQDIRGAVVVDGASTPAGHRRPGDIVRLENVEDMASFTSTSLSSHGISVATAVRLASAMGSRAAVVFVGVEVGDTSVGAAPGPAVSASIEELADRIEVEVDRLVRSGPEREEEP
jgi:hydrogenase maturation protease